MSFFNFLGQKSSYDKYPVLFEEEEFSSFNSLKNSDVFTAISIVATDVARFPIRIVDKRTGLDANDVNLDNVLNSVTDKNMSANSWKFAMIVNAITTGSSYARIVRDPLSNEVSQIQFYAPSQTYIDSTDFKNPVYNFVPQNSSDSISAKAEDVIHLRLFSSDILTGRSPLASLVNEIKLQNSGLKTLANMFASGGFKNSILKVTGAISDEGKENIKNQFVKVRNNTKAGEPIVIDKTMDYQPLEMDSELLQLINSNNYSTAQIAKALRVPAYRLAQNSPNQSIKQLSEDYLKNDLPFYFKPFEAELEMKLLSSEQRKYLRLEFDTREITGMSSEDATRIVANGLGKASEARNLMGGFPPLSEEEMKQLNRFQSSLNTVFLDKKEEYQDLKGGDKSEKEKKFDDGD